jgi:hypothetical protein
VSDAIIRPNGKPYRPRKPPRVVEFEDYQGSAGVAVLGTHDVDVARAAAAVALNQYDLDPAQTSLSWWRLVPWGDWFDRTWIEDAKRGAACVVFEAPL